MSDYFIDPARLDAVDAPPLTAVKRHDKAVRMTAPHSHDAGQLVGAVSGVLAVVMDQEQWVIPATHVVWIPPRYRHGLWSHGPFNGWSVYIAEAACAALPTEPRTMKLSGLLRETVNRAASWGEGALDARQLRIVAVIIDEIASLPPESLGLPLPQDQRLVRIARALIDDPGDQRHMEEWAQWAAIAPRTLTRRFVAETGFTFSRWRQRARLMRALEMLAEGTAVTTVALDVGYDNISAFIDQFRQIFGTTPARYFPR